MRFSQPIHPYFDDFDDAQVGFKREFGIRWDSDRLYVGDVVGWGVSNSPGREII